MPPAKESIQNVDPAAKWHTDHNDGTVTIRTSYWFSAGDKMSEAHRTAMALNEICCERGEGKVYLFVERLKARNDLAKARFDAKALFSEVPELFYVKGEWTEREQAAYRQMNPARRSDHLFSRNGWVPKMMPILPFDLELQEQKAKEPQFTGLGTAPVIVCIMPHPYVALTHEIRAVDSVKRKWVTTYQKIPTDTYFRGATWDGLEKWRVNGLGGVLDKLDDFYAHGTIKDVSCNIFYVQLLRWEMEAAQKAAQDDHAYAMLGNVEET